MKRSPLKTLSIAFLLCSFSLPTLSSAQNVGNKQQIISQARQAYYNLRSEGLDGFQCSVTPNWEALLADQRKSDPKAADAAIETLSKLHFNAKLGADGKVKLTHNDIPGASKEMMDALRQIYTGMEQMASGFFDTWSQFMLHRPFPEVESEYQLQVQGPQYLLTYKDGAVTDVATTMSRDFAIS